MSCNWSVKKLGDLVKFTSGGTPSKSNEAYWGGDIPWISASSMDSTRYSESELKVTTEGAKNGTRLVPKDTVLLLVRGGALHNKIPVGITTREVTFNQDVKALVPKTDEITPWYLLFWLISIKKTLLAKVENTGIGAGKLDTKILQELEVPLPPKPELQRLEKFCKALDDKIILNADTNQTLEQMAQAIFKSWFVDFDPVKAKMNGEQPEGMDAATASLFPEKLDSETGLPEGWKLSEIGDEVTVVGGGTPSKKNDDFWVDGHIHWTSPKDLSGVQDKVLLDTTSKVTEAGLKKISSGLLPVDTVLLSSRAPVGYLALAKVPMAINQGYIAMKCEKLLPPEFVIQWCVHRMDEIKQRASGSTFAEISKKSFKPISVVVPSEDTLNAYQKMVKPLYDAITSNARQNEQLSSLRDTLLPKLLSGELSISD